MEASELFDKYDDEYLTFEKVENKKSTRADLHAFLLLDELFPSKKDMVCWAEHDEFGLSVSDDEIHQLTTEQVRELVMCGIRYDDGGLLMFS